MNSNSIMTASHGVAVATAMAISGTAVILLALRLQKSYSLLPDPSCTSSSDGKSKKKKKKKKKRVQFAENVVDPVGNGREYRRRRSKIGVGQQEEKEIGREIREMPANRVALYNGILRDRRRLAYSY